MSDKDTLNDALEDFKLCEEAEAVYRRNAIEDLRFALLGEQWPEAVRKQRELEGRPCLTINRLPAFIKQVTNDARQNRPSINVNPSGDGSDKDVARIYRDLIRNIENVSKADIAYDTGLDFAAYSGIGYWVVRDQYTCEDSFDKDLVIERIANPLAIYGDYEGKSATSDDWNRSFIVDHYTERSYKKKWPGSDPASFEAASDLAQSWFLEKMLRVAEYWTREQVRAKLLKLSDGQIMFEDEYLKPSGDDSPSLKDMLDVQGVTVEGDRETMTYEVTQRIISGIDVLETNKWAGKYIPIVPCYGNEFNVNGKRHFQGLVRDAIDPARMFNYWRTAGTEMVALAPRVPYVGAVGAFATDPNWATANSASHQHLEYDPVEGQPPPTRQPFTGVPAGMIQEALNASDDMKNIMGLHDASLGARSNETSGRAIMARQREGDVSTFNFADNRNRAIAHTGTILVDLIPKHFSTARMIRCVKEDGSTYTVPVNQPVMPAQPNEGEQPMPGMPQEAFEPAQEEIPGLTKIFDLTAGKYDVTVSAGPSYTTKRQESSESMMEFIRVFPQSAPLIGDLLAKNQDWPGADEIAARLKAMLPPQAHGQINPMVQQLQQALQQQDQAARDAVGQLSEQNKELQQQLKDKEVETRLKEQEISLKERELVIKENDAKTKNLVDQTNADTQRYESMERPAQELALNAESLMGAVAALQSVAASMQQKPMRKVGKARKNPQTGDFEMETVEVPIEVQ